MRNRNETASAAAGRAGEIRAAEFLRRERGWVLVTCNWRNPGDRRDEIDLIGWDGPALVFVEVKTRASGSRVPGYFAVNSRKRTAFRRAAVAYLRRMAAPPRTFRFDVIEVEMADTDDGEGASIPIVRHFENIPLFGKRFLP